MKPKKPKSVKSFWIPIVLPGMNQIIDSCKRRKGNWNSYAELKSSLTYEICIYIREQKIGRYNCPIWLHFIWREPNKRRDPDNIAAGGRKFILDALVREGIIQDDGWKQIAGWYDRFEVRKKNPGVYVTIEKSKTSQNKEGKL